MSEVHDNITMLLGSNKPLPYKLRPGPGFEGMPRLTVGMVARLQGFPVIWRFTGRKTPAYRQVGNAFPPPVAEAVGECLHGILAGEETAGFHGRKEAASGR